MKTLSCAPSDDDPSRPLPSDDHHIDRRTRLTHGPIQPRLDYYPQKETAGDTRRVCAGWYDEFNWLEYTIEKDAALCFYLHALPQQSNVEGSFRNTIRLRGLQQTEESRREDQAS